jgi:hypothetical protein
MSYLGQGKVPQAKADLMRANELTGGKDQNIIKGLHQVKEKIAIDKQKEKEMNQKYYLLDHLHTHYNKFLELLNAIEKII